MKKCITNEAIRQYAITSKDAAGIHLNVEAAVSAGLKRPIAHGMYIMGLAQSEYVREHPEHWIAAYELKFLKPVFINSKVNFEFEVAKDYIVVNVSGEDGECIASGTMSVKERLP